MIRIIIFICGLLSTQLLFSVSSPPHCHGHLWIGNGSVHALVWAQQDRLLLSLERADLWDTRPFEGLEQTWLSYPWVSEQLFTRNNASIVHHTGGLPQSPGGTKLPAGTLSFSTSAWGGIIKAYLDAEKAIIRVEWKNGTVLECFVHPDQPVGWFRFSHLNTPLLPTFVRPPYSPNVQEDIYDKKQRNTLQRLWYAPGVLAEEYDHYRYQQPIHGGTFFEVSVRWKNEKAHTLSGVWGITEKKHDAPEDNDAMSYTRRALGRGFDKDFRLHQAWWAQFWGSSAIAIPNSSLMRHWYLAQYDLGISITDGFPPAIIATLAGMESNNTGAHSCFDATIQGPMRFWGAFAANHLEQSRQVCQFFSNRMPQWKRFTRKYYDYRGITLPGCVTPNGQPSPRGMPYTLSPTASAMVAQLYYQHWKYSMDKTFLQQQAWPWLYETAIFLESWYNEAETSPFKVGYSPQNLNQPENNWYKGWTNYELSLIRFVYQATTELALATGREAEAQKWQELSRQLPQLLSDPITGELLVAQNMFWKPENEYPAHLIALSPLNLPLSDVREVIASSIVSLESGLTDSSTFTQRAWLAWLKVRAKDGKGVLHALQLPDGTPDTLCLDITPGVCCPENRALIGIIVQEMLLQSQHGMIEVMPALPPQWTEVSFKHLRAEGAFLVSANQTGGQVDRIDIQAEKGGKTVLKLPFRTWYIADNKGVKYSYSEKGYLILDSEEGGHITIRNGYE